MEEIPRILLSIHSIYNCFFPSFVDRNRYFYLDKIEVGRSTGDLRFFSPF